MRALLSELCRSGRLVGLFKVFSTFDAGLYLRERDPPSGTFDRQLYLTEQLTTSFLFKKELL